MKTNKERVLEGKPLVQRVLLHAFVCTLAPFVLLYPYRLHVAFLTFIWWLV